MMQAHQMPVPPTVTHEVYSRCLCLHLQRATRTIARRFDEAFRDLGLTSGQYSLMTAVNQSQPPRIGDLAPLLATDRTTLTANLKPLERRGLVRSERDPRNRRERRLWLTDEGQALLAKAVPIWRETHDEIDRRLSAAVDGHDGGALRRDLVELSTTRAG